MTETQILENAKLRINALSGHLGFYYKNLASGLEYGLREDEEYLAASVIKLPLYLLALKRRAEGSLRFDERLTVPETEKVPGCGALCLFTGEPVADVATLCRLMICISDNTATNRLIRHFTLPGVSEGFAELGLRVTTIRRLLFDAEASRRGIQNTVSPREMGALLESLYSGSFVNPQTSREALDTLLGQQINHKLGGALPECTPIAHKTGEDENLSNDVGIVFANHPFILCFTGHDTDVYPWETIMRETTRSLYNIL